MHCRMWFNWRADKRVHWKLCEDSVKMMLKCGEIMLNMCVDTLWEFCGNSVQIQWNLCELHCRMWLHWRADNRVHWKLCEDSVMLKCGGNCVEHVCGYSVGILWQFCANSVEFV